MLLLKDYQQRILESLQAYFEACLSLVEQGDRNPADTAFYQITRETFGRGLPYVPVKQLPGLPYVCLRVPTGGGKTLIACHAVEIARKFVQADHALVLWLAPSTTIVEQTLKALKDQKHPYHQALQSTLGSFAVMDIAEALSLQPATLKAETVIIVSTMQAFRVEDSSGYNVYKENGALAAHFDKLSKEDQTSAQLDTYEGSNEVRPSLVNLLKLHRPVVFVDEAHNVRTELSFETLERFRPSCIVEFTATPKGEPRPSNVLHSVSAAELQNANMIKLPLRVSLRPEWRELLADALAERARLEEVAKQEEQQTSEYLRPIMLLQAESRSSTRETLHVDVLKQTLIDDFKTPENHIAISTGSQDDIADVNLMASDCPIRIIITVNKLREGWDCPFAYVLCSVVELRSSTAIEQLVGRVLRMPKAIRKQQEDLNKAYAFSASAHFASALEHLTTALVNNGFEQLEASKLIEQARRNDELPLPASILFDPLPVEVQVDHIDLSALPLETASKVSFDAAKQTLNFTGTMSEADKKALGKALPEKQAAAIITELERKTQGLVVMSPAERGEVFLVPRLTIRFGEQLELFAEEHLDTAWKLHECDALLSENEFPSRPDNARGFEIGFSDEGRLSTSTYVIGVHQQNQRLVNMPLWEQKHLVDWLDRNIYHPDISASDALAFIDAVLTKLQIERNLDLQDLAYRKHKLVRAIKDKIADHRNEKAEQGYSQMLFGDTSQQIITSFDYALPYRAGRYPFSRPYRGHYKFKKHFFSEIGDLEPGGEEFNCAVFLDTLDAVKYWVRNLSKREESFRLPLAKGFFYPDFVAQLNDGRVLVIEYKGAHLLTADEAKAKKRIGDLWAMRSDGKGLFVMPTNSNFDEIKTLVGA